MSSKMQLIPFTQSKTWSFVLCQIADSEYKAIVSVQPLMGVNCQVFLWFFLHFHLVISLFEVNFSGPLLSCKLNENVVDTGEKIVQRLEDGCFLAKSDIKSAFRIIPMHHPKDYPVLGIKWADKYYFDRCLPMGCSSSCAIFEAFSTTLEWLSMHKFRASAVLHILDDIFVCGLLPREMSHRFGEFSPPSWLSRGTDRSRKDSVAENNYWVRGYPNWLYFSRG